MHSDPQTPQPQLPVIETNNRQLRDKRADTIAAIVEANNPPRIFHGDTGLIAIGQDKDDSPILRPANREVVQNLMADAANWTSTARVKNKDGSWREIIKQVTPPRDLAENFLAQSHWPGVPAIDGIVTAPIVAPDGTICATPGYNPAARLWLALPDDFKLPDTFPNPANLATAKAIIFQTLLGEVAFADEASKAHALALMLLPFVRLLINGPTPLHLIDAPSQSSGKSFAAKICIAPFAMPSASSMKGEDEEWRKAILAALLAGRSHIFLDNVKGQLNSPALAAAITEQRLTERAMGGLNEVTVRIRCTWVATSNNARLDADTASRCVVIRLDTGMENPERRSFHLNPLEYIDENKPQVVGAIVTIIRHWLAQGRPEYSGGAQSRFSQWQKVMGGILESIEVPAFLGNLDQYRDSLDPEKVAWTMFCQSWSETHGNKFVTTAELVPLALDIPEIAATLGEREGRGQVQRLGRQLQVRRDKVFGTLKIHPGIPGRSGATYRVAPPDTLPDQTSLL